MDVALDDIVVHESVDDPGTFPFGRADNERVEEKVPLVDEAMNAGGLSFS